MSIRDMPRADVNVRPGKTTAIADGALQRWSPNIRAAANDDDATISILEVIGQDFFGEGVTSKRIQGALRSIGDRNVTVNINSPGGSFFEGLAIYNALREHKGEVTVKILGMAASAASVIAMAGDRIEIGRAAFLMIHNVWVVAMGDKAALREAADWLEPFDETAIDIYNARTGIDPSELAQMLDRETWISGRQAVDDGWADDFLSSDAVENSSDEDAAATLRAERRFDMLAARAGISRSDGKEILAALKGGKPGAASTGMQDAAVASEALKLLDNIKAL